MSVMFLSVLIKAGVDFVLVKNIVIAHSYYKINICLYDKLF